MLCLISYHVADGFLGDYLIKYGPLKVTIVAMVHVLRPVQFVVFFHIWTWAQVPIFLWIVGHSLNYSKASFFGFVNLLVVLIC